MGLTRDDARFLNLPFYQTGKVRKDPIGPADVAIVRDAARGVQAGDHLRRRRSVRSARHAPHVQGSDRHARSSEIELRRGPEVWLYRGAWQEWAVHEATWLVPMSQEELRAQDPGDLQAPVAEGLRALPRRQDEREFWQRVEARNKDTAALLDRLGLAEYFAMEAYVVE